MKFDAMDEMPHASESQQSLIDMLYEAALDPEKWPVFLDALASIGSWTAGSLCISWPGSSIVGLSDRGNARCRRSAKERVNRYNIGEENSELDAASP
jgi:hypothetical protein